jgi:predicted nucleotidyltransferase component of viral defense system
MKDFLRQLVTGAHDNTVGRSLTTEYLQARILQTLQESGAFLSWAFLGGTALRFLFSIPRYSEDLDFSLFGAADELTLRSALKRIRGDFEAQNYAIGMKVSDTKTVHSAFVRFPGLLHELGLSPHREEALAVKLEVDTNPPAGAVISTTVVRRHVTLNLAHYDKASLLSGKLHALLARSYLKGRDLYDLVWYLSDPTWPAPNFCLLNASLAQTGWQRPELTSGNWRQTLWEHLRQVDWKLARQDVAPFLERGGEVQLLTAETCERLLSS